MAENNKTIFEKEIYSNSVVPEFLWLAKQFDSVKGINLRKSCYTELPKKHYGLWQQTITTYSHFFSDKYSLKCSNLGNSEVQGIDVG